jgi:uncharacterized protein (DUF1778 family)
MPPEQRRTVRVPIMLTTAEHAIVSSAATHAGVTISDYLRTAALAKAKRNHSS